MKNILAEHMSRELQVPGPEIQKFLESPKDSSHGDLAFPCFSLSKVWRKAPTQVATELTEKFSKNLPGGFASVRAIGGYLNFSYDNGFWIQVVLSEIQAKKENLGAQLVGNGKTVVVDYSSPNVAKPMSIGHLRSTVIGQALVNIHRAMGYKTVGINYLGDWGVQFGKLAWAHLNKTDLLKLSAQHQGQVISKGFDEKFWKKLIDDILTKNDSSFDYLYALYVVFHALIEMEPKLDEYGRDYFLRLEKRNLPESKKDPLNRQIEETWRKFVDVSLIEYNRVYKLLDIKHDLIRGESFHEPDLPKVVDDLKKLGLLKTSEGAQIVDLDAFQMPPCLIQKSDGATLYATRDIAAASYRHDALQGDKLIYVVGAEQTLHFKQLFKVLELMGKPWSKDCVHIPFGLYRFKDGKMSTRRGNVVFLEDVLDRAIELVRNIIQEKNPDLKNPEVVAQAVGTAAVVFNDLMNDRQKNIDFDWDKLLDFNGDTGPYVQYTHVRCCSVLAKWNKPLPKASEATELHEKLELDLIRVLGKFNDAIKVSYEQLKPNWIAQYLLDLAKVFNAFYYEHRILEGDEAVQRSRIVLVDSTRIALRRGLELIGIQTPHSM